jgi:hypothetical protein
MDCLEVNKEMPLVPCDMIAGNLSIVQLSISSNDKIYLPNTASDQILVPLQSSSGGYIEATLTKGRYKLSLNGDVHTNQQTTHFNCYFCFERIDGLVITPLTESYVNMRFTSTGEYLILTMESDIVIITGTTKIQLWGGTNASSNIYYIESPFTWNIIKLD